MGCGDDGAHGFTLSAYEPKVLAATEAYCIHIFTLLNNPVLVGNKFILSDEIEKVY
jgi:hypothetical protein